MVVNVFSFCERRQQFAGGSKWEQSAGDEHRFGAVTTDGSEAIFDLEISLISNEERHSGRSVLSRLFRSIAPLHDPHPFDRLTISLGLEGRAV